MSRAHRLVLLLGLIAGVFVGACKGSIKAEPGTTTPQGNGVGAAATVDGGAIVLPAGCQQVPLTYQDYAKPYFANHCLVCHTVNATGVARFDSPIDVNFDTEADIAYNQFRIQRRTIDERAMPPNLPLSDCEAAQLQAYLQSLGGVGACAPQCTGKDCGDDFCGGVCGTCQEGQLCGSAGVCASEGCVPVCQGVACGDDSCGGVCGTCGPNLGCDSGGQCVCAPQCAGRTCGDDGCGGSCGSCAGAGVCDATDNCLCVPDCTGKVCGDDGCGGTCGSCATGDSCVSGACSCVPDCTGKVCGDDGCGQSCGTCTAPGRLECNTRQGKCVAMCMPDCAGRVCGDDGCGGSCGADCGAGSECNSAGQCVCAPSCVGKACGDDGCGNTCGDCANGLLCSGGQCGCTADCTGRECGSDGCGGSCGTCADGLSCSGGSCTAQCVPDCAGKTCGDDGCGGSCGSCGSGQSCSSSQCVAVTITFDTVYGIFTAAGCGTSMCHGGAMPKEGLDMSTKSKAQAQLVDVPSSQCSGKMRVLSGDSTKSYLINKMTGVGMCLGSQMPKGAPLSAADITTIRQWINGL